jgi:hypothetical protein
MSKNAFEGRVMVSFQIRPELRQRLRISLLQNNLELGHTFEAFTEMLIQNDPKNLLLKSIMERSRFLSGN